MRLSICIPTYNRAAHLANCLQSIISSRHRSHLDFQVCVSDNCSTDQTEDVVRSAQQLLPIKYRKNHENLGVARNVLSVVAMADGDFVWLLGDDDLLLPEALDEALRLIERQPECDYFYINSFNLTAEYVSSFPQPFSTSNLPEDMKPFSSWRNGGRMAFLDLVDPKVSFDFLGGMFLAIFRRNRWMSNTNAVDGTALADRRVYSHFDNTFVHVKIFAKAFCDSQAYFYARPLSVNLSGAREWVPMYPLVRSVRLVEALEEYRKNGLPYLKYLWCKNYALSYFVPDLANMLLHKEASGFNYISPFRLIFKNCLYPNFYLSFVYFVGRGLKKLSGRIF